MTSWSPTGCWRTGHKRWEVCPVKKNIWKLLLAAVFAVCLAVVLWKQADYRRGNANYNEAVTLAKGDTSEPAGPPENTPPPEKEEVPPPDDPYAAILVGLDLAALQEVNSDVLGWIEIPDTNLSYPLLQGSDNSYYLNHTWTKVRNSMGAIFLDQEVSGDLSDFNTIVYGHRMRNISMFGPLSSYKKLSFWREHPSVYIVDTKGVYRYDIYAAYEPRVKTITYGLDITDDQVKEEFIRFGLEKSVIQTDIVPTTQDKILTMSTCTGSGHATRWVVQAVLRYTYFKPDAAS